MAWSEMGSGAEMVNVAVLGQSCPVRVVPSTCLLYTSDAADDPRVV